MTEQLICCLRCRQCRLEPDTDMGDPNTAIFCGKLDARRLINLHGCTVADPRPYRVGSSSASVVIGGDKVKHATPAERAFVAVHYPNHRVPLASLARVILRDVATLRTQAKYRGLRRGYHRATQLECARASVASRRRRGQCLNDAQASYVEERYERGDWPARGGNNSRANLERRYQLQAEIVEEVAKLGPRWEWKTLMKAPRWRSPGYHRWDAKRRQSKKQRRRDHASR